MAILAIQPPSDRRDVDLSRSKLQSAYYEIYGHHGIRFLRTRSRMRIKGMLVIAACKRNDTVHSRSLRRQTWKDTSADGRLNAC